MQDEKRKTIDHIMNDIKNLDMNSLILVKNATNVLKALRNLETSTDPNDTPKKTA